MNTTTKKPTTLRMHKRTELLTGDKLCLEYSEDKEKLAALLKELKFFVTVNGVKYDKERDLLSLTCNVEIERNDKTIEFAWNGSHVNAMDYLSVDDYTNLTKSDYTKSRFLKHYGRDTFDRSFSMHNMILTKKQTKGKAKFYNDLKYSLLASINCEFFIEPFFEDFCSEFGYDEDGIKARDLHQTCLKHSRLLHSIFNESEMDCMPS